MGFVLKLKQKVKKLSKLFLALSSGIAESALNWMDSYFAWISFDGGCCGYYNTTTPSDPVLCDKPGQWGGARGGGDGDRKKKAAYFFNSFLGVH